MISTLVGLSLHWGHDPRQLAKRKGLQACVLSSTCNASRFLGSHVLPFHHSHVGHAGLHLVFADDWSSKVVRTRHALICR